VRAAKTVLKGQGANKLLL